MIKDFIKATFLLLLTIFIIGTIFQQYRHFYTFSGYTFTVWKRWGGTCYIMPYKHTSLSLPDKDYLTVSNVGYLTVFLKPDSSLIIFDGLNNDLKTHFQDYKFQLIGWNDKDYNNKWNNCKNFPYIRFSIREPSIEKHDNNSKIVNSY